MFELFGFWFNVTVCVTILLSLMLPISAWVGNTFVTRVTGDRELGEKVGGKVFKHTYWPDTFTIFNKIRVHEALMATTWIASGVAWFAYMCYIADCYEKDLVPNSIVQGVADTSTHLAPYTGQLAVLLVAYFCIEYTARKMWVVKIKVDSLFEKGE